MRLLVITQKVDEADQVLGFMISWLKALALQVESLSVICLEAGVYDLPANVKVYSLGKERGQSRLKYIVNFYCYLWQLRHDYDAVWVHMNQIYIILGWPVWRSQTKKISLWYAHGAVSASLRLANWLTDLVFTSSASGFRLASRKVKVVGQGIDTDKFKFDPLAPREIGLLVGVGRISAVKKQQELITKLAELSKLSWRLEFYGGPITAADQQYAEKLATLIAQLNLAERVSLLGSIKHEALPARLRSADLFVTMSRTGSLDKAVLEAMSAGVIPVTLGDTFKPILGSYRDQLTATTEADWVKKLAQVLSWSEAERAACREALRDEIIKHHSLDRLMTEIVSNLTYV